MVILFHNITALLIFDQINVDLVRIRPLFQKHFKILKPLNSRLKKNHFISTLRKKYESCHWGFQKVNFCPF